MAEASALTTDDTIVARGDTFKLSDYFSLVENDEFLTDRGDVNGVFGMDKDGAFVSIALQPFDEEGELPDAAPVEVRFDSDRKAVAETEIVLADGRIIPLRLTAEGFDESDTTLTVESLEEGVTVTAPDKLFFVQ